MDVEVVAEAEVEEGGVWRWGQEMVERGRRVVMTTMLSRRGSLDEALVGEEET